MMQYCKNATALMVVILCCGAASESWAQRAAVGVSRGAVAVGPRGGAATRSR